MSLFESGMYHRHPNEQMQPVAAPLSPHALRCSNQTEMQVLSAACVAQQNAGIRKQANSTQTLLNLLMVTAGSLKQMRCCYGVSAWKDCIRSQGMSWRM